MCAAHDAPVVSVLAVDDHATFLGAMRAVVGSSDDDPALQDASASCGAAVFMAKTRFGRHALASAWARFGRPTGPHRDR